MRHNTCILAAVAALVLLTCGCRTVPQQQQLDRLESVAQVAAYTTAAIYLSDKPETRPAFVSARAAVAALVTSENFDPTALALALSTHLPVSELQSDKAQIIITAATLLYHTALGQTAVEKPLVVQAFAEGILAGLDMALLATQQ